MTPECHTTVHTILLVTTSQITQLAISNNREPVRAKPSIQDFRSYEAAENAEIEPNSVIVL